MFGHAWTVKPKNGRLVEVCANCNATPEED